MKNKNLIRLSVIIVAFLIVVFIAVVFGGYYNVGATTGHIQPVEWVFRKTMESSVRNHAKGIKIPDSINRRDKNYQGNIMAPIRKHVKHVMERPDINQIPGCLFTLQLLI